MKLASFKTARLTALAMSSSLLLSSCFLTPGSFQAEMDVRKDGRFSFTYDGEIFMVAMSDLAKMANEAGGSDPCFDDETGEERSCSEAELAEQRAETEREARMMQAMMGSTDLSDPETAAEFAAHLERQAGWESVEYLGDGLFDVEFGVSSKLTHDFDFPTFEGFPTRNTFVLANRRDGSRVKIDAPGFAAMGGNPLQAMMGGMAGAFGEMSSAEDSTEPAPQMEMPQTRGTFRLVTDAQILTNNTDEGPVEVPAGMVLEWQIEPGSTAAPSALLLLEN